MNVKIHNPVTSILWDLMIRYILRDHSAYALSRQGKITLHCNAASHWLGAYTEWSLIFECESYALMVYKSLHVSLFKPTLKFIYFCSYEYIMREQMWHFVEHIPTWNVNSFLLWKWFNISKVLESWKIAFSWKIFSNFGQHLLNNNSTVIGWKSRNENKIVLNYLHLTPSATTNATHLEFWKWHFL